MSEKKLCLNLGCGKHWKRDYPDWVGIDIVDFGQEYVFDIEKEGLRRFSNESVEQILANDFLEHIGPDRVIFVMNECWRVLKRGGEFRISVPKFPHHDSVADPTHKSFWVENTFKIYFCGGGPIHADYSIKQWKLIKLDSKINRMRVILRKE